MEMLADCRTLAAAEAAAAAAKAAAAQAAAAQAAAAQAAAAPQPAARPGGTSAAKGGSNPTAAPRGQPLIPRRQPGAPILLRPLRPRKVSPNRRQRRPSPAAIRLTIVPITAV